MPNHISGAHVERAVLTEEKCCIWCWCGVRDSCCLRVVQLLLLHTVAVIVVDVTLRTFALLLLLLLLLLSYV